MRSLAKLFDKNRAWAAKVTAEQPNFFALLAAKQSPEYLWIGCADSRVPANEIVGLMPGEIFVHRNVANVVVHTDLNCLTVLQYAVDMLKVQHVIVCGHYGCGGVVAALDGTRLGLSDNWVRHVKDVRRKHRAVLDSMDNPEKRLRRLCELNVLEQALHVCESSVVEDAWARGQSVAVHAWIYGLENGLLQDLGFCVEAIDEIPRMHESAVAALAS